MRGTHWGKGTIGLQAAVPKRPHTRPLTFFNFKYNITNVKFNKTLYHFKAQTSNCSTEISRILITGNKER